MKTMQKRQQNKQYTIEIICNVFDLKRDAFYKYKKRYTTQNEVEKTVINLVKESRKILPREGTRKLIKSLESDFKTHNIKIGRDKLFSVLRNNNLLVKRKKQSFKTTNSYHRFYKYNNTIKNLEITRPNQVWASDITYIRTINGFCYLALITDMFSRKIVGYDISNSLELNGCVRALNKALYNTKNIDKLTHHSDRGIQYCSNIYTQILKRKNIEISMTE